MERSERWRMKRVVIESEITGGLGSNEVKGCGLRSKAGQDLWERINELREMRYWEACLFCVDIKITRACAKMY